MTSSDNTMGSFLLFMLFMMFISFIVIALVLEAFGSKASKDVKPSAPAISNTPDDTGDANENVVNQCLALIASITARADALGLSVNDELTPIREMLGEHAGRDDEHELKNDVLHCLRRIDARLETMSRDADTAHNAVIALSELDAQIEQVAVTMSAQGSDDYE